MDGWTALGRLVFAQYLITFTSRGNIVVSYQHNNNNERER